VLLYVVLGGKNIEDECHAIIKSGSKPLAAEAFMTKPGKLETCSHIIYAVVRPWQGGQHQEGDLLFTAVWNSLDIAAKRKLPSVAIAGVDWGFPANVACQTLLDAVADFQTQQHHFTDILLVDSRDQVVNHFHENLARHFGKQHVKIISGRQSAEVPLPNVSTANTCMRPFRLIVTHSIIINYIYIYTVSPKTGSFLSYNYFDKF